MSNHWAVIATSTELARASALPEVQAAAPVVWASGILDTRDDSAGLQIYGIDTASPVYAPAKT